MRHPLLALERVASVTNDHLIVETHVDMLNVGRPAMAFYPGNELNNDHTNWCGPNPAMVHALLRSSVSVGCVPSQALSGYQPRRA
jgi:tRNA (mo5U34)-methyltransferase